MPAKYEILKAIWVPALFLAMLTYLVVAQSALATRIVTENKEILERNRIALEENRTIINRNQNILLQVQKDVETLMDAEGQVR